MLMLGMEDRSGEVLLLIGSSGGRGGGVGPRSAAAARLAQAGAAPGGGRAAVGGRAVEAVSCRLHSRETLLLKFWRTKDRPTEGRNRPTMP